MTEDLSKLIQLYENRYKIKSGDITTLGWKNREEQELRFKILCDVGNLDNSSICDVGCGFGDLSAYLENTVNNITYTGIDITPSLLKHARILYPNPKYSFLQLNLLDREYDTEHDFILSSGALSFKMRDNMTFAKEMIGRMFELTRKGLAVNFLSTYVNYQHEHNFHYSPEDIFRIARYFTKWVRLRHDYPLWEFTIYLYKESQL